MERTDVRAAPIERFTVGAAPGWRIEIAPELGASVTRLAWTPAADAGPKEQCAHEIWLRPSEAEIEDRGASLSRLSSFLMLPFSNRIDGARFAFDGVEHRLPLNRPQQACAIHGHSRESVWRVVDASARRLVCEDDFARADTPYRYLARQTVTAEADALRIAVAVENRGARPMPFGFGLHPWFPRTAATRLRFRAAATFATDARTLPTAVEPLGPQTSFADGARPADRVGLDRCYTGWDGVAEIDQPDLGYRVTLRGEGALALVHVYVAADRPAFCVEPVSHVHDVVNRPDFARYGAMARLAPGERLEGAMVLAAAAFRS